MTQYYISIFDDPVTAIEENLLCGTSDLEAMEIIERLDWRPLIDKLVRIAAQAFPQPDRDSCDWADGHPLDFGDR